jgi:hypothetical protein
MQASASFRMQRRILNRRHRRQAEMRGRACDAAMSCDFDERERGQAEAKCRQS